MMDQMRKVMCIVLVLFSWRLLIALKYMSHSIFSCLSVEKTT